MKVPVLPTLLVVLLLVTVGAVKRSKVVILSFHGFRHDYLESARAASTNISAFERLWDTGFRAMKVHNEFTTKSGPNLYTMVTGQYEETHGFVDDKYYDPEYKEIFDIDNAKQSQEAKWFEGVGQPIWITNILNGRQSATAFWPGSYAKINDNLPTYGYRSYDKAKSLEDRFSDLYTWISKEEVTLGLLYYHEPGESGRNNGPSSQEVLKAIGDINHALDRFLNKIEANKDLNERLNIILASDHGMVEMKTKQVILMSDYLNENEYDCVVNDYSTVWMIRPKPGHTAKQIYDKLVKKHTNMHVYMKNDIPKMFYYSNHRRISEIIAFTDPGWIIARSEQAKTALSTFGDHGFDPKHPEMSPFFIASGPGFKTPEKRHKIDEIRLVDIYPMVCYLLMLRASAPNNGSLERVQPLLKPRAYAYNVGWLFTIPAAAFVAAFIILAVMCKAKNKNKNAKANGT